MDLGPWIRIQRSGPHPYLDLILRIQNRSGGSDQIYARRGTGESDPSDLDLMIRTPSGSKSNLMRRSLIERSGPNPTLAKISIRRCSAGETRGDGGAGSLLTSPSTGSPPAWRLAHPSLATTDTGLHQTAEKLAKKVETHSFRIEIREARSSRAYPP